MTQSNRPTVLIAEENYLTARLLIAALKRVGIHSTHAPSSDEALELASRDHQLLMLNLNFARPNGLELIRAFRSRGIGTPIIGLTLPGQADLRSAAGTMGVRSFLETPFDPADLQSHIGFALAS